MQINNHYPIIFPFKEHENRKVNTCVKYKYVGAIVQMIS